MGIVCFRKAKGFGTKSICGNTGGMSLHQMTFVSWNINEIKYFAVRNVFCQKLQKH